MKKQNSKVESVMKRVVTYVVDTELYEWPPQCTAFLYQPVRPRKANKELDVKSVRHNPDKHR